MEATLREEIDRRVDQVLAKSVEELERAKADPFLIGVHKKIREFTSNAGKRLRPLACMMAFAACGGNLLGEGARAAALDVAVGFELLHNSTLVHDDVMDEDSLRRGKPTVWSMFSSEFVAPTGSPQHSGPLFRSAASSHCVSHAIIAGNILIGEAMRVVAAAMPISAPAMPLFVDAYIVVNQGQVLDISGRTGEAEYMTMIEKKTGWLFRNAILAGASIAGASREQLDALGKYALEASAAFQIHDDIIDIDAEASKGHDVGSDIRQGKVTLLVSRAIAAAPRQDSEKLRQTIRGPATEEGVEHAIRTIRQHSLESVRKTAAECVERAKIEINRRSDWKDKSAANFFLTLADFVVARKV